MPRAGRKGNGKLLTKGVSSRDLLQNTVNNAVLCTYSLGKRVELMLQENKTDKVQSVYTLAHIKVIFKYVKKVLAIISYITTVAVSILL